MSEYLSQSRRNLEAVLAQLDPILKPRGFYFEAESTGVSSGGPYANGFYKRPPIQIGLIMRGDKLGSPIYCYNDDNAAHDELIKELGRSDESAIRFDRRFDQWKLVTVDGRPVLKALISDLENIIVPTITRDIERYARAVTAVHKRWLASFQSR